MVGTIAAPTTFIGSRGADAWTTKRGAAARLAPPAAGAAPPAQPCCGGPAGVMGSMVRWRDGRRAGGEATAHGAAAGDAVARGGVGAGPVDGRAEREHVGRARGDRPRARSRALGLPVAH